jgi:hypothetical protein
MCVHLEGAVPDRSSISTYSAPSWLVNLSFSRSGVTPDSGDESAMEVGTAEKARRVNGEWEIFATGCSNGCFGDAELATILLVEGQVEVAKRRYRPNIHAMSVDNQTS